MKIKHIFENQAAWDEGYQAFVDGVDKDDNPYVEGARAHESWFDGWNERARERAS